jgi:hypothetical protein
MNRSCHRMCEMPKRIGAPVKVLAAAMTFGFLFLGNASAEMKPLPKHTFGIGTEVFSYHYWEQNGEAAWADFVSHRGVMAGVIGSYAYHGDNHLMIRPEIKGDWGSVDTTAEDNAQCINNVASYIVETRILAGYDYYMKSSPVVITPYTGFGYRYLKNGFDGKVASDGAHGYDRNVNYYYSPLGVEALKDLGNNWFLGFNFEYDFLWKATTQSHTAGVPFMDGSFANDVQSEQGRGWGIRASIKLMKKTKLLDVTLEPFYRLWNIPEGTGDQLFFNSPSLGNGISLGSFYEPRDHTEEIGANLTFSY